jgi:hypothetical protein
MFSALVDVFFVPMLEVDYRVVSGLLDEGFWWIEHWWKNRNVGILTTDAGKSPRRKHRQLINI